jgi:cell division protein FtsI/penicillin-binding protein 2
VRWALLAAGLAVVVVAAIALWPRGGDPAGDAARRFAADWTRGDDAAAGAATTVPARARAALAASRRGLDGAGARVTVQDVATDGDHGSARMAVRWAVPRFGAFAYATTVPLARGEQGWRVVWRERDVHPALRAGRRLGTARVAPSRASILARDGGALVRARPVVEVGVLPERVRDLEAVVRALADTEGVDGAALRRAVRAARPDQLVAAVTLREADYARVEPRLRPVPGIVFQRTTAQLAPTRGFARALLGTVGPATAEQVARSRGRLVAGDDAGQGGLEAAFDARLAGTPEQRVLVRDAGGVPVRTLATRGGVRGRAVRTTLATGVQRAAETALAGTGGAAALVAVQPSTGDVLAAANRPTDEAFDRALEGQYPPGSTFKVVSTEALLRTGLRPGTTVPCPATRVVDGRSFRNFEGDARGAVPFSEDFAQSCNTAFISLAGRLRGDALTRAAARFGFGRTPELPVPAFGGVAPTGTDAVARAATMIGQDRILASPLGMAGVAATVADGRWRAPRLLADARRAAGAPLPPGDRDTLAALMREVVERGTGTALAPVPGGVAGKSGTAEFGGGDPPPTHAWFIAFRGDVAVAVLVERGSSGGHVAAPLAARFFTALGA